MRCDTSNVTNENIQETRVCVCVCAAKIIEAMRFGTGYEGSDKNIITWEYSFQKISSEVHDTEFCNWLYIIQVSRLRLRHPVGHIQLLICTFHISHVNVPLYLISL